jgi:hypothetical protein
VRWAVDDTERAIEIDRLLKRLSEATTRKAALVSEAEEFAGRIDEIRAVFGNPYFYSGANRDQPGNADQSVANYSGFNSHDVILPTVQGLIRIDRELRRIKEELRELGVSAD